MNLRFLKHRVAPFLRTRRGIALILLLGVPVGQGIAWIARAGLDEASTGLRENAAHVQKLEEIIDGHLGWAERQGSFGVAKNVTPVHEFFVEARRGTRGFAEDVLGWKSKWLLGKDYLGGGSEHEAFVENRFSEHIFRAEQLDKLIESSVATCVRHLSDVDSQVLVRLQADLEGLPSEALPAQVDRQAIQRRLKQAVQEAVASVQADFRGTASKELVSFVSGEVLALAAARLATSAGILSVGAGTGTVTFMGGLVIGIIVDYIVSWAYDKFYDPVGEIATRLDHILSELEEVIVQGDGSSPGLERLLRDYASRRAEARSASIRAVVLP